MQNKIISKNKKASFNYFLEEKYEAGLVLNGPEVKSLRVKGCNLVDSHADFMNNELFIFNVNIQNYDKESQFNKVSSTRPRKLLLNKKELRKLIGKVKQKGYTIIPVCLYFNEKNIAKIEIALAKGKKIYDKREDIKQKDWNRDQSRILRGNKA